MILFLENKGRKIQVKDFDTVCTVHFVELLLRLTYKFTKNLLTLIYFLELQHVSIPKYRQGTIRMLKLQAN